MSDNDTVTIKVSDSNDLDLSLDSLYTSTMWADGASGDSITVTTGNSSDFDLSTYTVGDGILSFGDTKSVSITLGGTTLYEQDIKNIKALLDLIGNLDDDNELKQLLKGQLALNEIGKE